MTHPNTAWSDIDLTEGIKHWTRAQDLSAAFDTLLDDPRFAGSVDSAQVMAAGFSYGGWTALSRGGARANHAGMIAACTEMRAVSDVCARFLSEEVGLEGIDPAVWDASYGNPRVAHVAAVEPGFIRGLEPENVADFVGSVTLIGLGDCASRFVDTDFEASGVSALRPEADAEWIVPGHHFTAMPLCTAAGPGIQEEDNDDPACTDPAGTDRAEVRDAVIARLAARLDL